MIFPFAALFPELSKTGQHKLFLALTVLVLSAGASLLLFARQRTDCGNRQAPR
jgi:hypothetical protein